MRIDDHGFLVLMLLKHPRRAEELSCTGMQMKLHSYDAEICPKAVTEIYFNKNGETKILGRCSEVYRLVFREP